MFNSSERSGTIAVKQKRKGGFVDVAKYYTSSDLLTFFPNQSKPEILLG